MSKERKFNEVSVILFLLFAFLDLLVWHEVLASRDVKSPELYFLDVGQGDAEFVRLPPNIKILIDAGPNKKILESLEKILGGDYYIDLAFISHPQLDHFDGFNYLLKNYKFGAFLFDGRNDSPGAGDWQTLLGMIKEMKTPLITLSASDSVIYGDNKVNILSPTHDFIQSAELNDAGLVEFLKTPAFNALFTADIGSNVENYLTNNGFNLKADILKVAHHGSRYSSSASFLESVSPKVAVIEVGEGNNYGHPNQETLGRLNNVVGTTIFRTDRNGTVKLLADSQKLYDFTEK